jgi:cysteine-rich repeat protein
MVNLEARSSPRIARALRLALVVSVASAAATCGSTDPADAACNLIPGTQRAFRSAQGTSDHAFASPGDPVEIALEPTCDATSACLPADPASTVVTVVFKPLAGGQANVAILATDCSLLELEAARAACAARNDVASAACIQAGPNEIDVRDARRLRFAFPDTDGQIGAPDDDVTWSGPAAVAVTSIIDPDPVPCALASGSCAGLTGTTRACIDALLAGPSAAAGAIPNETFRHFTALPPPNDFQAVCTGPSPPCTGRIDELHFALDSEGNLLLPVDWRGILVSRAGVPVARLLQGTSPIHASTVAREPIRVPGRAFVASFSPEGGKLPPIFDPQAGSQDLEENLSLFGSADAPRSVLRLARRGTDRRACAGGPNTGLPCFADADCLAPPGTAEESGQCLPSTCRSATGADTTVGCEADADCPAGTECGPGLFDFRSRLVAATGPLVVRRKRCLGGARSGQSCSSDAQCPAGQCGSFDLRARDPVPLDGLSQSDDLSAFVVDERIENQDLNGDRDQRDDVVLLASRRSGVLASIGDGGRPGRAVVRVRQRPFSFPALAAEADIVAFLESEALQAGRDANADGDVADTVLRVFRADGSELTAAVAPLRSADPAPVIDGRSVTVSRGLVVYRRSEAAAARRITQRIGGPSSSLPALDDGGSLVAFRSTAANLVGGDTNGRDDVFVYDRATGSTERVSVATEGTEGIASCLFGCNFYLGLSGNGRFAVFSSAFSNLVADDTNGRDDVFLHDRATAETMLVSRGPGGLVGDGPSFTPSINDDGSRIVFTSVATNLLAADAPVQDVNFVCGFDADANCEDVFVRDRASGENTLVSVGNAGQQGNDVSFAFAHAISADGRRVVFTSLAKNLVEPNDRNGGAEDVFLRDLETETTELVHVDSGGEQGNFSASFPSVSADGRFVAFQASSTNLVPGDTNGATDVFVRDLEARTTERVSVGSAGDQGNGPSGLPALSADGRFVAFESAATNLVDGDTNRKRDVFVHDRLTGTTERVSVSSAGRPGNRDSGGDLYLAISGDGRFVAFRSEASNLDPGRPNENREDVFVRGLDEADPAFDVFRDGRLDDTVLEVMDTTGGGSPVVTTLCPATTVSVAGGHVAYLRPEADENPALPTPECPKGPLNGDTDVADLVVQLWSGGATAENLGRAATTLSLSDEYLAALVPEAGQGEGPRNGDGDSADLVAEVYHPLPAGEWHATGQAADSIAALGSVVAFLTPEAAQGEDLDGDGDASDRVLQLYDPGRSPPVRNTGQPAEEFVVGPSGLVAFRTREISLCPNDAGAASCTPAGLPAGCRVAACDRNGDGDCCDDVLQVYDFTEDRLISSGSSVTPCRFEACDPRVPYRAEANTVTFLTLERDEGCSGGVGCFGGARDLNGDLDADDLVLQVFNVRAAAALPLAGNGTLARATGTTGVDGEAAMRRPLAAVSAGVCTNTGAACASDEQCGGGGDPGISCFVPPGGCILDLGTACDPTRDGACGLDAFCEPTLGSPGSGRCKRQTGPCASDADCTAGAACSNAGQSLQRLVGPLSQVGGGGEVFTSAGRCLDVDDPASACCASDDACASGEACDLGERPARCGGRGSCRRDRGLCMANRECPAGSTCRDDLLVATASDRDGDEIADAFDDCPAVANPDQSDADGDGLGDACEATPCGAPGGECESRVCGNGIPEPGEACDDGNRIDGDGCDADCAGTLCSVSSAFLSARMVVNRLGPPAGDETLTFTGRIDCSAPGACDRVDPLASGAQVRIDFPGSGLPALLDLTQATAPVPPGGTGAGCDARDGWRVTSDGRSFTYANRSGRLPGAGCSPGSSGGLRTLRVIDRRPARNAIDLRVVVRGATLVATQGPVAARIVLDAVGGLGGRVPCGSATFAAGTCGADGQGRRFVCE